MPAESLQKTSEIDPSSLSGAAKAAILLLSLGEEISATLFKHLSEDEVKKISQEISKLGLVHDDLAKCILEECHTQLSSGQLRIHGNLDHAKRLIHSAFSPDEARDLVRAVAVNAPSRSEGLSILRRADPRQLSNLLQNEHPQTVALVVSHLEGDHAAQTLGLLPEALRSEVCMRMARLDQTKQSLRDRVLSILAARLGGATLYGTQSSGSVRSVAEVLNRMDRTLSGECLDLIENEDPTLAVAIRDLMFVFDDILLIGDQDMRKIIQMVDKNTLVKALKGTQEELRDHFYRNMSERAREMLQEDMEAIGPIPIAEAQVSQHEVVSAVRQLESDGEIDLSGSAGDQYVVYAYSGETGHPIRGKWPPGRSEATLGIS